MYQFFAAPYFEMYLFCSRRKYNLQYISLLESARLKCFYRYLYADYTEQLYKYTDLQIMVLEMYLFEASGFSGPV